MIERRQVSWKALFKRHFLWAPLIPLLFGLVFGAIGAFQIVRAQELARDGVDAVAEVLARNIRTRRDSDGNTTTSYVVTYRFQPTSDQTVETSQSVSRGFYNEVQAGQEIAVRYLPRDPSISAIEPSGVFVPGIFLLIGLTAIGGGLFLGWILLRNKFSLLRAARRGEVREARVTDHVATGVQVNGRTKYRFAWVDAAGNPGESALNDYRELPQVDSVVTVYIDPRSGRGWWEGDF